MHALRRLSRVFLFVLLALLPSTVYGATIFLDPASGSYGPGDTFIVAVRVNPDNNECINAGQVELRYPPDVLRIVDVSRGDSIFSLWVQDPTVDASAGTVVFAGGVPGGYCGIIHGDPAESNVLARVVFRAQLSAAPTAALSLGPRTEIYLNDGKGTLAPLTKTGAVYTMLAKATLATDAWVDEVKSDTTPPEPFDITVTSDPNVFHGAYFAVFSTTDKQSGIDHYEILENGFWQRVESPHRLSDQSISNPIEIKAIDKAGNERLASYSTTTVQRPTSAIADFSIVVFPLLILAALLLLRWAFQRGRKIAAEFPKP